MKLPAATTIFIATAHHAGLAAQMMPRSYFPLAFTSNSTDGATMSSSIALGFAAAFSNCKSFSRASALTAR